MYMFVRRALQWEATDYGYWVTYRNLLAALGEFQYYAVKRKCLNIVKDVDI